MAISQTAAIVGSIKRILLDDVFWESVTCSLRILKPKAAAIARIEGDNAISRGNCSGQINREVLYQEFCIKPIHSAAYMLDPKYENIILSAEEISSAYTVITAMSHHLGLDKGKVLASLVKYLTKQGLWEGDGIWQSCQHIPASTWWKGLCGSEALAPVASIILQIPPKSAASERNLSLFGNTHTKVCSRLTNARVEKLVAIQANLRLFEPDKEPSSTRLDGDTEAEDESDVGEVDMEDVDEVQEEAIET
ncbi:uncharacterized protein LOC107707548 [Tachysurus ichikawai]